MSIHMVNSGINRDKLIFYTSLFIFSLIALLMASLAPRAALAADQAVVKEEIVNLRAAPTTGSVIVGKASRGDLLEVLGKEGDWYRVGRNGSACWVASWLVEIGQAQQQNSPAGQAVVKEQIVNLRAAPTTASAIMAKASRGDILEVLGKEGDWYRVGRNGSACWVASWLVEFRNAPPAVNSGQAAAPDPGRTSYVAEITTEGVNIRSGPGTSYSVIGRAGSGSKYSFLEQSGDWYKVALNSGSGWVSGQFAKLSGDSTSRGSASGSGWAVVNGSGVNIRTGPGTTYQVVTRANRGERYLVADRSADWYKIILNNGQPGWVVSWLVEVDRNSTVVPPPAEQKPAGGTAPGGQTSGGGGQGIIPPPATGGEPAKETKPPEPPKPVKPVPYLKSVSAQVEGANTVITVKAENDPINFTVSSLDKPDRLVIDINGFQPAPAPGNIGVSSPLAGGIRVGWFSRDPSVTRIVVDLKAGVRYEKYLSSDSRQLRIVLSPRVSRSLSGVKIVLDPGHGGNDPGAIGPSGAKEKDVNLAVATKAAQYLRKQGAVVTLTRTTDSYVELYDRPKVAEKNGAALFLSIHSNANPSPDAGGTSTYYLQDAAQGMDQVKFEGMYLARNLQSALTGSLKRRDLGVLRANYAVLTRSKVPAALVEVAFISNPAEEKMLVDDAFRGKVAQAITQGIADYFVSKQ